MPKVTVNHTGSCDGYTFQRGVPVDLPEEVLTALGDSVYKRVEAKRSQGHADEQANKPAQAKAEGQKQEPAQTQQTKKK